MPARVLLNRYFTTKSLLFLLVASENCIITVCLKWSYFSQLFFGSFSFVDDCLLGSYFLNYSQILTLCNCKEDQKKKVHAIIDKFAERGLRSLGVASQV